MGFIICIMLLYISVDPLMEMVRMIEKYRKILFCVVVYIKIRLLLIKYKIPYRYVKSELVYFLFKNFRSVHYIFGSYIFLRHLERVFIKDIKTRRVVETKRFNEQLRKTVR